MKNLVFRHLLATLFFFSIIFISAGRLDYWQGWVYVVVGLLMFILSHSVFRIDEELMVERSKPGENTKNWDKKILGLLFLSSVGMFVVAGLDSGRFNWSPPIDLSLNIVGIILTVAGQLIFIIAQKQNRFFSSTVRIQTERNHAVCDTGLYKVVRHPAYLGSFIQSLGFPLLFGSFWSTIPIGVSIFLLLLRTYLEDKTLMAELAGYIEYAQKVRYRIVPYLW
jgi:protein-S-isoprenylcysteine O-methyltransferase Ste14